MFATGGSGQAYRSGRPIKCACFGGTLVADRRDGDSPATRTMVGMADSDDGAESEFTDPILDELGDIRRRFVELWNRRDSGDEGAVDLAAAWAPLANLLEGHASAKPTVAALDSPEDGAGQAPKESNVEYQAEEGGDVDLDRREHAEEAPRSRPGSHE
jgi:hypothetical protein